MGARVSWRRPDAATVKGFLAAAGRTAPAAADLLLPAPLPPPGYRKSGGRHRLGEGDAAFAAAVQALQQWRMFALPWLLLVSDGPPRPQQDVALVARVYGLFWTCACRVVDLDDRRPAGFAFTYAALPAHVATGAERFAVERDADGGVWFAISAQAKPQWPAALCPPLFRALQRRFVRDAARAMAAAVAAAAPS